MARTESQPGFEARVRLFGDKIRQRRKELDLSERQLAAKAQIERSYLSLLLKDRGGHKPREDGTYAPANPTLEVIWKLADALELDPAYLVDSSRPVIHDLPRSSTADH